MNNTMVNIIRWILIIPTYIASYVIIRLIALGSFTMFSMVGDGLLLPHSFLLLLFGK